MISKPRLARPGPITIPGLVSSTTSNCYLDLKQYQLHATCVSLHLSFSAHRTLKRLGESIHEVGSFDQFPICLNERRPQRERLFFIRDQGKAEITASKRANKASDYCLAPSRYHLHR
ncbi:hypothetical protein MUK42_26761 [Musa troglodytarum]|uniref:Uncharacterized protein n=1 Tax=Musa troglodytarum TaxID=320322 RepID=A0A9E7GC90_9LILI|nr:hypothetical protein MUK42_26761 [Musa troglodytarum]